MARKKQKTLFCEIITENQRKINFHLTEKIYWKWRGEYQNSLIGLA